jgi:hypothetical protein
VKLLKNPEGGGCVLAAMGTPDTAASFMARVDIVPLDEGIAPNG